MRIKIILAPLLIVMTIILLIWFVYPAYTNGVDGLKEQLQILDKENKRLQDMNSISDAIEKTSEDIASNKASADMLYGYLPDSPKEEEIIDNVNYLSAANGLSVLNLSVLYVPNASLAVAAQPSPTIPASESIMPSPTGSTLVNPEMIDIPQTRTAVEDIKVNVSVSGKYEKIKSFFDNLYMFKRFNSVASANISTAKSAAGKNTDEIQVDAVLNFNVLGRITTINNLTDEIFSRRTLDQKTMDGIGANRNVDILKLQLDGTGKANPFLP